MSKEQDQGTSPAPRSMAARKVIAGGAVSPLAVSGPRPAGCLLEVRHDGHSRLVLSERLAWFEQALTEIVVGGIYLVAGAPGSRKSGLTTQLALDFGLRGIRTLTLLTEESPHRLLDRALRMTSDWPADDARQALGHAFCCDELAGIERLPGFLYQHVLAPMGRYHGASVIILDSVQGHGLPAAATEKYARLYEFCRIAKSAGITVFMIGHVNKKGQIAGPRDLEHNVDAVVSLRKAMDLRLLYVPKNRFGPEQLKGLPLVIDPVTTTLRPSPHREPVTGICRTFLGTGVGAGEMQAMVSLPSHNARPQIQAPGLPRRKIEQLLSCIARVPGLEMEDLDLSIGCLMPGDAYFRSVFGLPLSLALIGSYLRRSVPPEVLALGEIDLNRAVRPLSDTVLNDLAASIAAGELGGRLRVLAPPSAAGLLPSATGIEVVPCPTLDAAIRATWPEVE